jgi:hypothetical protein
VLVDRGEFVLDGVEADEHDLGHVSEKRGVADADEFASAEGENFGEGVVDLGGGFELLTRAEDLGHDSARFGRGGGIEFLLAPIVVEAE